MNVFKKSASLFFVATCWVALFYGISSGAENSGYFWQWFRVERDFLHLGGDNTVTDFFLSPMCQGLAISLKLVFFAMLLVCPLTILLTSLHMAGGPISRFFARCYIEVARNTPLLVQLFVVYIIAAPRLGLQADIVAIVTLALCHAAFISEILRAGLLSVSHGQYEAGLSLGLCPWQAVFLITGPQALRRSIPPLLNQGVALIKDTSLASIISVTELTFQAKFYASASFTVFETWITVGCVYLVICLVFSLVSHALHAHCHKSTAWSHPTCSQ